jgi:CHAT domain-containing protein
MKPYLDILVRSQATVEALEASERFRLRGFVEMLNEARVDIRQGVEPALISQEQALARQINNQQQTLMRMLGDSSKVTAARDAETRLNDLFLKYQETEATIRARSPAYAALIHPASLTLTQIQSLIDPGSMVLEYWLGEKTSYVWAIARDSIAVYALPERARVEREVERFYKLLTARQVKSGEKPADHQLRVRNADAQYRESATSLSRMLLAPVMPQIGTKRLLIVADGAIHYIPFAALPTPGGAPNPSAQCQGNCLLLHQHEIVSLPSVSVLAALRERKSAPTSLRQTVAVYADPVFDKSDPRVRQQAAAIAPILPAPRHLEREMIDAGLGARLPRLVASRLEAQGIESAASSGQSRLFLDFFASRDQVLMSPLNDYRILHFATHGFIDNTHPELSGLVLSLVDAAGSPQDGFLRLHEIYNLRLNADLVVLSACNTALGKNISGEGLIGLTRGFMYAGARRVMATLWKVDDEAAAEEMRKLYQHLLARGEAPAAALRAAQLEMLNSPQWQAPYYWSAFTLQGD